MQLQLVKSSCIDKDFVNWMMIKLPFRVLSKLTNKKFVSANRILKESRINVDPRRVIIAGCRSLQIIELKDVFVIDIRRKVAFSDTDRTVRDLCSMIEYGNMTTPGTHVFTEAFREIENSLDDLYSSYLTELI